MKKDRRFIRMVEDNTPKLNPVLANGVAVKQLEQAERYIDLVIRSASRSFPEGLVYKGCERATPIEEYNLITSRGKERGTYDIARSDLYLMKYFFAYEGKDLEPRYMYLPFVRDAGYITINSVNHLIMPTLNDIVFSITKDSIFVRLLRDRLRFQRLTHHIHEESQGVISASVVYSQIHNKKVSRVSVSAKTTNMHYLLAKYGFTEAFRRFANCEPVVGYEEINTQNYPSDKWAIYRTATGRAPRAVNRQQWAPTMIRVAVPHEQNTHMVRSMVAGFFYVVDHFPLRVQPKWIDSQRLWRVLLGHLTEEVGTGEGTLYENMSEHIRSLDQYMDVLVIKQLKDIGYDIQDLYQILALLLEKFSDWLRGSTDRINSMYGKELNVNYFVLFPITSAIFTTIYRLNQILNTRKALTERDVNRTFDWCFTMGKIYLITNGNAEVVALTTPNDNKALRLTSMMVPQSANEMRRSAGININDPSVMLHTSIAEVGGYSAMSKRAPDGRRRLNHCLNVDENYRIVRNPDFVPLLDQIQELIRIK